MILCRGQIGFTLLEVLIALAVLSIVALLAVKSSGDSQTQIAETRWRDDVLLAGRGKLIQLIRQSPARLESYGTLAPDFPQVEWSSHVFPLQSFPARRLELRLVEDFESAHRELVIEYVLP